MSKVLNLSWLRLFDIQCWASEVLYGFPTSQICLISLMHVDLLAFLVLTTVAAIGHCAALTIHTHMCSRQPAQRTRRSKPRQVLYHYYDYHPHRKSYLQFERYPRVLFLQLSHEPLTHRPELIGILIRFSLHMDRVCSLGRLNERRGSNCLILLSSSLCNIYRGLGIVTGGSWPGSAALHFLFDCNLI